MTFTDGNKTLKLLPGPSEWLYMSPLETLPVTIDMSYILGQRVIESSVISATNKNTNLFTNVVLAGSASVTEKETKFTIMSGLSVGRYLIEIRIRTTDGMIFNFRKILLVK